ncbi:MAG: response regulator transcription factor [Albidovulum sp.]|nr:response regulator transcription factor [Albidovulum sp.]MDE0308100.1 response regulator transcription factor [Albidovulum sp.]MDE0532974.1 response regulator transcription factor [Albidovulum sp.]
MAERIRVRMLVVEDNSAFRDNLVEGFEIDPNLEEFRISCLRSVPDAESALEMFSDWKPDIALVDNHLPGMTGSELGKKMRELGINCPIIIMSGEMAEERHVADGLRHGANEFVLKPFGATEIRAKLNARLRDYMKSEDVILRFGEFEFHPGQGILEHAENGFEKLTAMESKILKYLFLARRETVGRHELLAKIWGYNPKVDTHTLETHVYRLRQKIEPNSRMPRYLQTSNGGYRLVV